MPLSPLKACDHWLIDVEGTLVGDKAYTPVPGAVEWIAALRDRNQPFRILTNNTTMTLPDMAARLTDAGFAIGAEEIVSCQTSLVGMLKENGDAPDREILVLGPDALIETLATHGLPARRLTGDPPAEDRDCALILGYLPELKMEPFIHALALLRRPNCRFLAMHRNRVFRDAGRIEPGLGAWVAALEYASGREAEIGGKPSPAIFLAAARELGVPPERIAMVGDDPRADLVPARRLGMQSVFVLSGKYADHAPLEGIQEQDRPSVVLPSVADLI